MHLTTPLILLTTALLSPPIQAATPKKTPKNAILLSNVETLTLRGHNAKTTHRRVSAIPQLKCISHPSLCRLVEPRLDLMRCTNQGSSYGDEDVEWSCSATLPEEVRLGSTDVICEGYSSSEDPYVLKGSCGVEYRVVLTDKGEERYPELAESARQALTGDRAMSFLFFVLFFGVIAWMVYSACTNANGGATNQRRRGPRRQGPGGRRGGDDYGPGGGGGGGWDPGFGGYDDQTDPPPPYPGTKTTRSGGSSSQRRQQESWRPGFWSGLAAGSAAGGAAGYAAGRSGNRNNNDYRDRGYGNGGGFWGSRSNNGESSSSGSRRGPSGNTHEGTGFGSTTRR